MNRFFHKPAQSIPVIELAFLGLVLAVPIEAADTFARQRARMVEEVLVPEGVTNRQVLEAMGHVPRQEFVPARLRPLSYIDEALPIGEGQTISPPSVIGLMTQAIDPRPDDRVLEIGTGSGYQAAVLSRLVSDVYTIEIVESLARRAAGTLRELHYRNVHVVAGDGFKGAPEHAPFDKILVTCSPEKIPEPLADQLKEGGRLVIPLGERYAQTLYLFTKRAGKLVPDALEPTVFVPMMGEAESERRVEAADPAHPHLVNGGFEELSEHMRRPAVWFHQRQLQLEESNGAPEGQHFVTFTNRFRGRKANASQALAVDGRRVKALGLRCYVQGNGIEQGKEPHEVGAVLVTFSGADRSVVEAVALGRWTGTFGWRKWETRVPVPPGAREAIVTIGLFGATGSISFDAVSVEPLSLSGASLGPSIH